MFAQSFLEYGALSSLAAGLRALSYDLRERISNLDDTTWVAIGLVLLLILALWSRRSPRL